MCRTALEFPPNGKRCGKGDHLTPEARNAWRIARNAQEKQRYYARKENKAAEQKDAISGENVEDILAELDGFVQELKNVAKPSTPKKVTPVNNLVTKPPTPVDDIIVSARQHLSALSKNESRLADGQTDSTYLSTTEQREQLAALLNTDQGDLAYLPVTEDDEKFADKNDSTNNVRRITLTDGSVGYFKPYEGAGDYDDSGTTGDYGHSYLATSLNEVAAYRLAQALGKAFHGFVPETVMREYDGKLGTLQREATGRDGVGSWELRNKKDDLDMTSWRRAAIFDVVAGSQDRHSWNYLVSENEKGQIVPTLIDNGYAFPDGNNYINMQGTIDTALTHGTGKISITERKALTKLKEDPTLGGITEFISKSAADGCRERIEKLLTDGIFHPTGSSIW